MSYKIISSLLILTLATACMDGKSSQQNFSGAKSSEIVNGKVAKPQDIAGNGFATSVVRLYVDDGYCTGTLLSPKIVLTAAHCFDGLWDTLHSYIAFQTIDLRSGDAASAHKIAIEKYIVHPDYAATDSYDVDEVSKLAKDDIAVVLLQSPVPSVVRPAQLPQATDSVLSLDAVTAAGYGISTDTYAHGMSGRGLLQYASFPRQEIEMRNGMILITDQKSAICHGDSGGPLYAGAGATLKNVVVGMTDFGMPHPTSFFKKLRWNWSVVMGGDFDSYAKAYPNDELCVGYNGYVDVASHRQWILETAAKFGAPIK